MMQKIEIEYIKHKKRLGILDKYISFSTETGQETQSRMYSDFEDYFREKIFLTVMGSLIAVREGKKLKMFSRV